MSFIYNERVVILKTEKREVYNFRKMVSKADGTVTLKKEINRDCRVKKIYLNFPDGEDGDLKMKPYAKTPEGSPIDLVNIIGDENYFSGNNSKPSFDVDVPLRAHSTIYVDAYNDFDTIDYPIICDIEVVFNG